MDLAEALKLKILKELKNNNLKKSELCYKSGVPCSTLSSFLNNKTKILQIDTILHICEGLNTNLTRFFADDLFTDTTSE